MICDAIAARKPDLAHAWATTHVLGVEEWVRRALSSAAHRVAGSVCLR